MSNRCRRLPTPSRRERKRPQRIASPASEPVLRPTPTPVNVSLGAVTDSTPIPTVLRTHLFSVAWLPGILVLPALQIPPSSKMQRAGERSAVGPVSYECRRGFLRSRLLRARLRSRTTRMAEAWSMALTTSLRGRPGGRRVRRKTSTSSGRMAHTIPTLIPYSRCRSSIRRT